MSKINNLFNSLDNDDLDLICDRLGYGDSDLANDRISKILTIESIYKTDKDTLGYLLTGEEIEFLKANLDKSLDKSSLVLNLNSLALFLKDTDSYYKVPEELKKNLKRAISAYESNSKQIEDTKVVIYLILGLIRIKGALKVKDLISKINEFVSFNDELFEVCLTHPLFKRFLTIVKHNRNEFVTFKEFKGVNYDFYKFYNKNIDTDKLSVFTIGKNIIDTSSTNYDKILDYPRVCYVLGKINKNELILFVGNNNYDYENFIDIELLDYLDDEDIRVLDDYFRTLPSFIDVSENSLFINPRVGNDVDSVVSLLYRQATITYKKRVDQEEVNSDSKLDDHIRKLQISMLENNFSIVDDMIETYDLTEKDEQFLLSLKSSKEQEYAVLKCRKDGIELVNTKTLDTYLVKIELNNYYRDHKLIPHLAHITLAVYDSNLIMFTYAPGRDLMKEELDKYNDIFKHSTEIKKSL